MFVFIANGKDNFFPGEKWPGGVVKYEFHSSLNDNDRREAQRAFDDIQSKTCIRFEPRANGEAAYTSIEVDDNVCGLAIYVALEATSLLNSEVDVGNGTQWFMNLDTTYV